MATEASKETHRVKVEFSGGLEMLFDNITEHKVDVPTKAEDGNPFTVGNLIPWICQYLMKDSRKELFVLEGNIRPGILVLINEADWELEGEDKYELLSGDSVFFVSTLHGG